MNFPDYNCDNIVNLASSILKAFNADTLYPALNDFDELNNYKNIILIVFDGLGYEYLRKNGNNTLLQSHCVRKLSSVFPPTTASALTTLETGVAPQQHGITGWYMHLKELGVVSKILPYVPRYGGKSFPNNKIERRAIFTEKRIGEKINSPSYIIYPSGIVDGKVNIAGDRLLPYKKIDDMFGQIQKVIRSTANKKFIYAYYETFDDTSHKQGNSSKSAYDCFAEFDHKLEKFAESIKGSGSVILLTADHGFIDSEKSKIINLNLYPDVYELLTLPLCGEPRAAYCYVHPEYAEKFESLVQKELGFCCDIYKSSELIRQNAFGLFEPHHMLRHRAGDYVLIMKENYAIIDFLLKEEKPAFTGFHGGLSEDELYVPLVMIRAE